MSITARTPEAAYSASANNLTCNVPAGTTDGDLMFALVMVYRYTISTATGWTLVVSNTTNIDKYYLYRRIASSEPANYNFTFSTEDQCRMVISSFVVSDMISSDPIASSSATNYRVDNIYSVGTISPPHMNMPIFAFSCVYDTIGIGVAPPSGWTEVHDAGETDSDFYLNIGYTSAYEECGSFTLTWNMLPDKRTSKQGILAVVNTPKTNPGSVMMF
jgi:hypothetical protein